jgi:PII-like signaling protein
VTAPITHADADQTRLAGAAKLTVYFGERSRARGRLLADELLETYGRREIRASMLLRGAQGFGTKHRLRTDRLLTLSEDLPAVAVAVDSREKIEAVASEVRELVGSGLVTLESVRFATDGQTSTLSAGPRETLKLTAYLGRHERVGDKPAFAAVCQMLHERGVSGATVLLGVDGTRHGRRRRARFFGGNTHVPAVVLAVGEADRILDSLDRLREMMPTSLLTLEDVEVCKRDGRSLQTLPEPREEDLSAEPIVRGLDGKQWQRLTVVTSEAASHEGRPVHLELVRRLRAAEASGATSLRGIWGFHGAHAPHGDRLLALRRHVPVVTELLDLPHRVAALYPIVDELTSERGLVTSEMVPANMALPTRL